MRNAAKLSSILLASLTLSLCLTVNAFACPGAAQQERAPVPDPEPPAETEPAEETPSAGSDPLILSDSESVTLRDEQITVPGSDPLADGGEGYVNTPDAGRTAAAPWPLGVNGSSRAILLTGQAAGLSLVRSGVTAGGWGALCVDAGPDAAVTAVDSTLRILSAAKDGLDSGWALLGYDEDGYGSGYGVSLSGGASAYFYGSKLCGGTYGAVLDGTERVWFGSSSGTVLLYDGPRLAGPVRGRGQTSSIDGVFGLMMCGDTAGVTVTDATAIHAAEAAVLCKDGSGSFTFDNARLTSDSGVIFQMMDSDDDDRIGLLTDTYGFSPVYDERNVCGGPGFPTVDRDVVDALSPNLLDADSLPPAAEAQQISVSYANGLYSGNIYNGTGYYGQPGDSLAVTVGSGAVLDGDISLTSAVKAIPYSPEAVDLLDGLHGVKYCLLNDIGAPCEADQAAYIQFLRYTIGQYYLQGHVENLPYYNGSAALDVTVAQDGVWAVKGVSTLTSLTVEDGALVYGQVQDNADGSITLLPAPEPLGAGTYASGAAAFAPAEESSSPDEEAAPAEGPDRQVTVTIDGREYTLDVHEQDGAEYIRLTDLIALFFSGGHPPSI